MWIGTRLLCWNKDLVIFMSKKHAHWTLNLCQGCEGLFSEQILILQRLQQFTSSFTNRFKFKSIPWGENLFQVYIFTRLSYVWKVQGKSVLPQITSLEAWVKQKSLKYLITKNFISEKFVFSPPTSCAFLF